MNLPLRSVFAAHPRQWREFRYVYPVISRRARGLSLGINLNPDMACNFDCVYCQVDRSRTPTVRRVDLAVLAGELRALAGSVDKLFNEPEFQQVPPSFRRLNDFAFSGDGEPTAAPTFPEAVQLVVQVREELGLHEAKIVLITDACFLARPAVADALALLDQHNGEIWAKLDAGTEEYFAQVNRARHTLAHVLENILAAGQARPLVIQSLFMRLQDAPPPEAEIAAYVARLRELRAAGAQIALVQIYTVARRPAEPYVSALTGAELEDIGRRVRELGLRAEVFD